MREWNHKKKALRAEGLVLLVGCRVLGKRVNDIPAGQADLSQSVGRLGFRRRRSSRGNNMGANILHGLGKVKLFSGFSRNLGYPLSPLRPDANQARGLVEGQFALWDSPRRYREHTFFVGAQGKAQISESTVPPCARICPPGTGFGRRSTCLAESPCRYEEEMRSSHFLTQIESIFCKRFFLRFSFMIQHTSESGSPSHLSMRGLPSSGRATTATLQQ